MPNYQNGKIYKITCEETKLVYYGSSVQSLSKRLSQHKENKHLKKYKTNLMTNPKIHLIENFPCNTKAELEKRERHFIENNECVNRIIPTRTPKEYYQDNKEFIKQQSRDYRNKNKEKTALKRGVKVNCECGGKYTLINKSVHSRTKRHIKYVNSF